MGPYKNPGQTHADRKQQNQAKIQQQALINILRSQTTRGNGCLVHAVVSMLPIQFRRLTD